MTGASPAAALTAEQRIAVERRDGPLLVSAGAGSGKTSVLVERFVAAVVEDGVAPGAILATTFTERAAGELRERIRARLIDLGRREAARDTEAAYVCTIHGFCARLLRSHPLAAGLDPDFDVLDELTAARLRSSAFGNALTALLDPARPGGEGALDLVAIQRVDRLRRAIDTVHAALRSRGERWPRLPEAPRTQGSAPQPPTQGSDASASRLRDEQAAEAWTHLQALLEGFGDGYEQLKRTRRSVDFDDLELLARDLLRDHPAIRAAWSERFGLIMVDEFQDVNARQLEILEAIERDNLFTVGDECQSIYAFRHADLRIFRRRRELLGDDGAALSLVTNFRSRRPLLDVVNLVFEPRLGSGFAPLVAGRAVEAASSAPLVELLITDTDGWEDSASWRVAEARALARRIGELVRDGAARAGEIAVLLRAVGDIEVYERALLEVGLPTLAAGSSGFWGDQPVVDLLAYLRTLANPLDEVALYGALSSPLGDVGAQALALIAAAGKEDGRGPWAALAGAFAGGGSRGSSAASWTRGLSDDDRTRLAGFFARCASLRDDAARLPIWRLIERAVLESDYDLEVLGHGGGERRLFNVRKLQRLAEQFEQAEGRDLRGFLDHAALAAESAQARERAAPVEDGELDVVRLMSIHAAKGLEFPVVCVADLGRSVPTDQPDVLVEGVRIGLRLATLDGGQPLEAFDYAELCTARQAEQQAEEERVLYVAMTRARERLMLSGGIGAARWPAARPGGPPMSWLGPALVPDLAERLAAGARRGEHDAGGARIRFARSVRSDPAPSLESRREDDRAPPSPDRRSVPPLARPSSTSSPHPPMPGTVSYTSLSAFERCGYRFYLQTIVGLPSLPGDRSTRGHDRLASGPDPRLRGVLAHALLEEIDFRAPQPPSPARLRALAAQLGIGRSRSLEAELAERWAELAVTELFARLASAPRTLREAQFALSIGAREPLVTGAMDVLAHELGGGALVVDYKTDRLAGERPAAVVERHYRRQQRVYALAALRDGALEVEVAHWFLEQPDAPVIARYTQADADGIADELRASTARMRTGEYRVTDSPHRGLCGDCPGRRGLCSWDAAAMLRELPAPTDLVPEEPPAQLPARD